MAINNLLINDSWFFLNHVKDLSTWWVTPNELTRPSWNNNIEFSMFNNFHKNFPKWLGFHLGELLLQKTLNMFRVHKKKEVIWINVGQLLKNT
jgi:hypothetical protein